MSQNYANLQKPGSSSRFSSLNVFKFKAGSGSSSPDAPPPPPKDPIYSSSPSTPLSLSSHPHHSPNSDTNAGSSHNASLSPPSLSFYSKSLYSRSATSLSVPPSLSRSPSTSHGDDEGSRTPLTPACAGGLEHGKGGTGMVGDFGKEVGGRGAASSPVPSNSGTSLRSVSGGGSESVTSPSSVDGSTDSSGSYPNVNATSGANPNANLNAYVLGLGSKPSSGTVGGPNSSMANLANALKSKKSMFKFSSLGKHNFSKSRRDLSGSPSLPGSAGPSRSASVSECDDVSGVGPEGDEGISTPWNFQHHIHVDEGYIGLPPSWSSALSEVGFSEDEIVAIHARRKAVAAAAAASNSMGLPNPHTQYSTERPASPLSTTLSPTLLSPVPRGTSLGKLGGTLRIDPVGAHPPSMYSVSGSVNGGTSPAPSPRAPSFGMKSFMSSVGLRSSRVTGASIISGTEIAGGERERESVVGEASEQYVFVDGDGPDAGMEGMGDETLIEPYPFDAASVSTHQTHASRSGVLSQGQGLTSIPVPSTQGTTQIQIQRARSDSGQSRHIPFPTTSSRAPSPLVHSTSLPIPTPPRGYTYSGHSSSGSPSPSPSHSLVSALRQGSRPGAATAPPRTPPRRIYHVVNASSDSYDGQNYGEPPPAYVSPKRGEWVPKREKEALAEGLPPPTRPVPSVPIPDLEGESSRRTQDENDRQDDDVDDDIYDNAIHTDIPETADDVLDISTANSSFYSDANGSSHADKLRVLTPTPPLVIDKRLTKLGTLPPRISFHQEGSLEDWSEALFSAIDGGDGKGKANANKRESKRFSKRFSVMAGKPGSVIEDDAEVKAERRRTLRPMSPLARVNVTEGEARVKEERRTTMRPMSPLAGPLLPDMSFGGNISLGAHVRQSEGTINEDEEHEEQQEEDEDETCKDQQEHDQSEESVDSLAPSSLELVQKSAPFLPDVSLGANVSSIGRDIRPSSLSLSSSSSSSSSSSTSTSASASSSPQPDQIRSASRASIESPPPPPVPPKPKLSLSSIASKSSFTSLAPKSLLSTLAPSKANTVPGIEVKSPVSPVPPFFGKPMPLPLPIPPSQIKAQLRPPNTKLPRSKSSSSLASDVQGSNMSQSHQQETHPMPLPDHDPASGPIPEQRTETNDRPPSSSALLPTLPSNNPGDRDSGMSTMTVTPATIVMVKGEVVRRAVASVVDSDVVSLVSKRESVLRQHDSAASASGFATERGGSTLEGVDDSNDSSHIISRVHCRSPSPISSASHHSSSPARNSTRSPSSPTWPSPPPAPPVELDTDATPRPLSRFRTTSLGRVSQIHQAGLASPLSARFSLRSSETHRSSETVSSMSSESAMINTPKSLGGVGPLTTSTKGKGKVGVELAAEAKMLVSRTNTFGGVDVDSESDGEDQGKDNNAAAGNGNETLHASTSSQQPQISTTSSSSSLQALPPSTPQCSLHPLISSLQPYLSPLNPISYFTDLVEIAEGESGSVYAARVSPSVVPETRTAPIIERVIPTGTSHVAIKRIVLPSSPALPHQTDAAETDTDDCPLVSKLASLLHELTLLKGIEHEHLLLLDAVYVASNGAGVADRASTALDSSLWIRMELMERSLADVVGLVNEGLALQERMVGRFSSDVLLGLEYLQKQHIAHRDVRSDNLLLNSAGIVKIADFSNAIRVTRNAPVVTGAVGVVYWQAPEMRAGPYNALKVDVWSLGATVWELAETVPPFSMPASPSTQTTFAFASGARHPGSQWPSLSHPEHYSKAFHEFLRHCGREAAGRPGPAELLNTQFIRNACGRAVILQLLSQCRSIEEAMVARENDGARES